MVRIILIETSTSMLSTALVEDGAIVSYRRSEEPRMQASLTAVFVKEMLQERGLRVSDCDAVCVSKGPGSYTGLRVGSSTAKGLCFGAGIPLLAVDTMEILVNQAIDEGLLPAGCSRIIPMIDARRMEVYSAQYSADGCRLTEIAPVIVDSDTFLDCLATGPCLFIGDGALKCREVVCGATAGAAAGDGRAAASEGLATGPCLSTGDGVPKYREVVCGAAAGAAASEGQDCSVERTASGATVKFVQTCPDARAMLHPALAAWDAKRFEDTAYFEPFYLKDFVATVSKKSLF